MNAEHTTSHAERVARLERSLRELGRVAIAYSGGVDSGVLLHAARAALGAQAFAVIADSPSLPRAELSAALDFARSLGVEPTVLATEELDDPRYVENAGRRCYFCKSALFDALGRWAREHAVEALAFGEIADDAFDDRPGRAAAREAGVHAPLAEAGFTKDDVRRYAREHGLAIAEKPASACLASRIPVGTRVTRERLARVEQAEAELRALGLVQLRVRDHGERARVEVGADELELARRLAPEITVHLAQLGFREHELAVYRSPTQPTA